jgi:hypothetical protein
VIQQRLGMGTGVLHAIGSDPLQQIKCLSLGVTSAGSLSKHVEDGLLWYPLQLGPFAEGVCSERCSERCNVSTSARNQVSMTCTMRNACRSLAPAGLTHPSRMCKCSQTSDRTAPSLSTRRSEVSSTVSPAARFLNASKVCCRPPPRMTRGLRRTPAASKNLFQARRKTSSSSFPSPPPSM